MTSVWGEQPELQVAAVTVGIPVTDEFDYLQLAIKSVFAQTRSDWRLIIACDGSPQEIVTLARSIKDSRVTVLFDGVSRGLPARLNEIAALAETPFLARMDQDDIMTPDRLERQIAHLERSPELDILGTECWLIDEQSKVRGWYRQPDVPESRVSYLKSGVLNHPSVLFRTTWAKKHPYVEHYIRAEDKELWLRASASAGLGRLPEVLMFYRMTSKISASKSITTFRTDRQLIRDKWREVGATQLYVLWTLNMLYIKEAVLRLSARFGVVGWIYRTKFVQVSDSERQHAQTLLDRIKRTPVPGWD